MGVEMTERAETRVDAKISPTPSASAEPCDVCGAPTFERHCKVICRRCGYTRDCSDP